MPPILLALQRQQPPPKAQGMGFFSILSTTNRAFSRTRTINLLSTTLSVSINKVSLSAHRISLECQEMGQKNSLRLKEPDSDQFLFQQSKLPISRMKLLLWSNSLLERTLARIRTTPLTLGLCPSDYLTKGIRESQEMGQVEVEMEI